MVEKTERLLEVCVDDIDGLQAAIDGGADRIELCSALALGGLTPSSGLMSAAARSPIPCYAMIRSRPGDFVYSRQEIEVMIHDVYFAASAGLAGVVFGASLPDGRLDAKALIALSNAIGSMPRTLHRAFDLVPNLADAVELAVDCGFERILTSGRAPTALAGVADIAETARLAGGRLAVMPGAGINLETIDALIGQLPVMDIHASCSVPVDDPGPTLAMLDPRHVALRRTDAGVVRQMKERLRRAAAD
jgi:copper homeostasis protein